MVCNNVYHHPNVACMACLNQTHQTFIATKETVDPVNISSPIAVIPSVIVIHNGADPDGIKS